MTNPRASENSTTESASPPLDRRRFLTQAGMLGAAALPLAGILTNSTTVNAAGIPAGDVAILKFLAAAELLECDLWGQYCELATGNPHFRQALQAIDSSLPDYICGDFEDECSHAEFINSFLASIGEQPVNLDPFRTLPSSAATGAQPIGRLTNLMNLTVDTSYYYRYRSAGNPDFGTVFPQVVNLINRPTIPLSDVSDQQMRVIAQTAAFHFGTIEQGGGSLYNALSTKVTNLDVLAILASIGPTEIYHFAVFRTSLEGITRLSPNDGIEFPDFVSDPTRGAVMPKPCWFLNPGFPLTSVIRPRNIENAGAVAAATALAKSGLFTGQSQAFVDAAVGLAIAADSAIRAV